MLFRSITTMTISVLISVYSSENPEFLGLALDSIWGGQERKPDQVVLVEDGPLTPELRDVIERFRNQLGDKFSGIRNPANLGLTKSLNRGMAVCRGDYVARMDSDDISAPSRFRIQAEYLDNHPDIAIVGGSLQEFNADHDLCVRTYPRTPNEVLRHIFKASPLAHPAVMMRRSMFENGISYNEKYRTSQDIALWYDAICNGYGIANVSDIVLRFRRDGDVFKRRGRDKAKNELIIYLKGIRQIGRAHV